MLTFSPPVKRRRSAESCKRCLSVDSLDQLATGGRPTGGAAEVQQVPLKPEQRLCTWTCESPIPPFTSLRNASQVSPGVWILPSSVLSGGKEAAYQSSSAFHLASVSFAPFVFFPLFSPCFPLPLLSLAVTAMCRRVSVSLLIVLSLRTVAQFLMSSASAAPSPVALYS